MKSVILLGPPGSGKGTQSEKLCKEKGWLTISTGQILRQEIQSQSAIGLQVKQLMEQGSLVPDSIVLTILSEHIAKLMQNDKAVPGLIFDGFPRTLAQAQALQDFSWAPSQVHYFELSDDVIVDRLSGRRVHPSSGRTYHIHHNPPLQEGIDDVSGESLIQRADDREEVIKNRLKEYHAHTAPLIQFYQDVSKQSKQVQFFVYDASLPIEMISEQFQNHL